MKFRTEVAIHKSSFEIDYKSKMLFLGSCFSDNISQRLIDGGFAIHGNPFGVLYNPISIKNGFEILLENKVFYKERFNKE